ncbi:amino acid adenylation domain-containing protein [Streptomyces sp. S186]|uniref:amino acid adenylation domain-containing protein n=1 Tax=Streptomyces sp. S186 TaxID=3434395 RepID=UPI003F661339
MTAPGPAAASGPGTASAGPADASGTQLSEAKQALLRSWLNGGGRPGAGTPAATESIAPPAEDAPAPPVEDAAAPLSFTQLRLWFLEQISPGNPAYNLPLGLHLTGDLDVPALEWALDGLLRRHEVLRSVVREEPGGGAVQRVQPHRPLRLRTDDLRGVAAARRDAVLERIRQADAREPFDLRTGPLLRARLLRLADRRHFLLLTLHHIAADGWAGGVLLSELDALYAAFRAGRPDPLPAPALQFGAYAARQRRELTGARLKGLLDHWRTRLAGAPMEPMLPTDRPRPATQDFRGDELHFTLPARTAERLRSLAADCAASPFAVALAAFHTVLLRWSGREDQLVGVPVAGRTRPELQGLVGYLANTVVLRTDLAGDPSFRGLVERVRDGANEAYAHQDLPFEKLVEELQPDRDAGSHPVFQVLCTWQSGAMTRAELAGLEVEPVAVHTGTAKFDLQLGFVQRGREITGRLEFAGALFDRATAERFLQQLLNVLDGAADDPGQPLSRLPLLAPDETARLLRWAGTGPALAGPSVPEQIARQAAATPGAVAVVGTDARLTFAELDRRADALAARLRAAGIGPEAAVGVCLPRTAELVAALVAVQRAGAGYVPLDPAFPDERLGYLLADTGAAGVLTTRELAGRFAAHGAVPVWCVDEPPVPAPAAGSGAVAGGGPAAPDNLAYVIHTSGSTGAPKGVQVSHRNMADVLGHTREMFAFGPDDVLCAVGTVCFDIAVPEIFLPLVSGARLVMADEAGVRDGARLRRLVRDEGVTVLMATPATWRMLIAAGWDASDDRLRLIVSAGEALSPELDAQLRERVGDVRNLYGPTETTVWAVGHRTGPEAGPVPIGSPVGSARTYVVDRRGALVPPGVPGELLIGGAGVTRGYRGRPALTADRYVPDPYGPPGARLYRTGDQVRRRADGTLEYLGRLDNQVKIRGHRIEPGEVEAALRAHPAVGEAVVLPREGAAGTELHAYLVPSADGAGRSDAAPAALTAEELRRALAERLPAYMCPAGFTVLDALPVNANGKVDRRALAAAGGRKLSAGAPYQAPGTDTAKAVAAVWREVLGAERVGLHDNFFDLGGHSLLALQVQAGLRAEFGRELPIVELFQYPTVAALSAHLDRGPAGPADGPDEAAQDARQRARGRRAGTERLRERRAGGRGGARRGTGDAS